MERWVGKIAVVTGAAGGIGLSLARALSENGMIVVGLDKKKQEMLDEIKNLGIGKGKFYALSCDVSDEDSVTEAFGWIKKNLGVVQVLLNNAGCMVLGGFADTTPEIWRNILDVNLMGSIHCATTAIKMMREANLEGHVINMNSIAGHRIYLHKNLYYNIYGVTKHGITGFTETLQRELMGQNIRVTVS
uniref:DHRS11_0 protein n=1 Tax=Fopius arisanus TaxID=64838 RepID=A0A0C9RFE9_9HYME